MRRQIGIGALGFRLFGAEVCQAPIHEGVPALVELDRLLQVTERILRDGGTGSVPTEHFESCAMPAGLGPRASTRETPPDPS
jgi:serine/threonine-protein kinase HipA